MSEMKAPDARTVQFNNVRLSFTDGIVEPKAAVADGPKKFGCNIILDASKPEHASNMAKAGAALNAASKQEWDREDMWKVIAEDNPKRVCFRKGERFRNQDSGEIYQGYEGNFAISGSGPRGGKSRPKLYDRYRRDVAEKDIGEVCYSGSYADIIVSFYGNREGGNGVFCSIEAIRSRQEGDRIGGGGITVTSDMFSELPGEPDAFEGTSAAGGGGESAGSGSDFNGIG